MQKFRQVFKTKQSLTESQNEKLVLGSFKKVYAALLEKYRISEFNTLNEERQPAFLAELHSYWDEKAGILPKGIKFLRGNSDLLTEKSTSDQKRNFMKKRAVPAISETFKQSNLKYKLYDIIDEMYKSTASKKLGDVLTPKEMTEILVESFRDSVKNIMTEIKYELNENSGISKKKPNSELNEREFSTKERQKLAKEGKAMKDGGFPIVIEQDLKNAVKAYGRGNQPKAEKAHIKKRAKALGAENLIPQEWKQTNEGFFSREKSEDQLVAQKLVDWAREAGIKAKADSRGFIRDSKNNILASVTPTGYIDVSGVGNFAPEELDDNMYDIVEGMKLLVGGRYN